MNKRSTGLFGSSPGMNMTTAAVAEFIGTFILVFAITATVSAAALHVSPAGQAYSALAIVLVNGLTVAALATALGHVSGGHLNPAVTLALAITGDFPWRSTPIYLVAQFAGACLAAVATWLCYGAQALSQAHLGATAPAQGVGGLEVLIVEALISFVLVFVIVAVATDDRAPAGAAPLSIGFALAAAVFIGLPITGAGVNPARALGPMIVSGQLTDWWAYLIGPVIGGTVASLLYDKFLEQASVPVDEPLDESFDQSETMEEAE